MGPATKPCGDVNDNCSSWKNQYSSWFTKRCTGSMKNEKPSQVSPLTMGEACQKSCGLCGGTTPATKPCGDVNDNCSSWKNQYSSWFTERCTGSKKNEKPSQVSPLTLGEACQKSCGLCGDTTPATKPCVNTPPGNCNTW